MMTKQAETVSASYRIGAVARLTGVSPDTLRIWERRYAAVSPQRSARGGRLYSPRDVARLRLMKQLVEAGDAIGAVARLGLEDLEARAANARRLPFECVPLGGDTTLRLLLVGESLLPALQNGRATQHRLSVIAVYRSPADLEAGTLEETVDLLVIELTTLHEDGAARVVEWLQRARASRALVVYRYASAEALSRLPASKCSALRAPVDAVSLQTHCLAVMGANAPELGEVAAITQAAPARRYNDETLARLANLSSTVKCECPRHLAELITSLSAFERYSTECESRSARDAALHAFLHATAARARLMIEDALGHVVEVENIQL
jgi:DNA-binding transcriptional MerR regulator